MNIPEMLNFTRTFSEINTLKTPELTDFLLELKKWNRS